MRVVYGDPQLTAHFDAVRREIMTLPRERKNLQTEVREMRQKCALISAVNIAIALISKLMKGIRYRIYYPISGVAYASEKPKLTRGQEQRAYSGTITQNDVLEGGAMALTVLTLRFAMNFIIWRYRMCRAMCRRIAWPQSVNWCTAGRGALVRSMKYGVVPPNFESLRRQE
ncbi:hypothetical protein ACLK1T_17080 [Escherichia coli]